ncbi:uncharacterized protein LOC110824048 isoform X2 [Carica papaya]|uniref:uncharacterized protein LOC110824048 isoform X2 n=1 Tax=Carica papaya TaxID=3649 RepID=UPI000B8C7435|nr:uncharacterized protein LOC110824048 isoform X2 [Carica papaya]
MSLLHLQIHNQPLIYQTTFLPPSSSLSPLNFLSLQPFKSVSISISTRLFPLSAVSKVQPSISTNEDQQQSEEDTMELDYLAPDGVVYQKTLRLVECSMFAAVTGLVYFLSNSLAIENYFGCFFSFPIVISSIRWGIAAGRKTMVATALLLFVLSGPVKALTYLLTHGLVGFTMGSLWRYGSMTVRSLGAMGYVLTSSFLIRENILALITINIHASLSYIFATVGINTVPSMSFIYTIFGTVLLLNSIFFVFLLHLLYSVFLSRLGMKSSLRMPVWLEKAL